MNEPAVRPGEPDMAAVAAMFADPRRVRILVALSDGRALPATRLAAEAGVAASTASTHLSALLNAGLVSVESSGRHRFYRLASPHVEGVLEALSTLAPTQPITSLRAYTRAGRLRAGRTCYRHLAGRLGVELFGSMIAAGWVTGGDGSYDPMFDSLSAAGKGTSYRLTDYGAEALQHWDIDRALLDTATPLKYCVDWTEQAHHLAGPLGASVCELFRRRGWVENGTVARSVMLTDRGRKALSDIE
ncbi:metalloregulator ArsR/SmtB family transcription factor [Gordonia sinesedis]